VIAPPKFAAYGASKFALEAITMAMRAELAPKGIKVVVIRPGPVRTPFRANAMRSPNLPGYDTPNPRSQDPRAVADMTLRAIDRGTAVVETTPYAFAASLAARLAPPALRLALRRMAARG
jgi:short-subunit dehydrogenase